MAEYREAITSRTVEDPDGVMFSVRLTSTDTWCWQHGKYEE
jgi:hypothetical protein